MQVMLAISGFVLPDTEKEGVRVLRWFLLVALLSRFLICLFPRPLIKLACYKLLRAIFPPLFKLLYERCER
jgi:hypothetical protein